MARIDNFRGNYTFLSNFYMTPVDYKGISYTSVECAFQAQKTLDENLRKQISQMNSTNAKKFGKSIELREDWDSVKDTIMEDLVRIKFNSNSFIATKLVDTYPDELVEGNVWGDWYWGEYNGKGLNKLGRILMKIRQELIDSFEVKSEMEKYNEGI